MVPQPEGRWFESNPRYCKSSA